MDFTLKNLLNTEIKCSYFKKALSFLAVKTEGNNSGGCSLGAVRGLLIVVAPLLRSTGSRCWGFSCRCTRAQWWWGTGLVTLRHVESPQTSD